MSDDRGCHVDPVIKAIDQDALARSLTAILAVSGMGCPTCAMRVRNGLLGTDGVVVADVVLEQGIAGVAYDPAIVSPSDLLSVVAHAGDDSHHVYSAQFIQNMPSSSAWNLAQA
jgi:copper chaperone CopZ